MSVLLCALDFIIDSIWHMFESMSRMTLWKSHDGGHFFEGKETANCRIFSFKLFAELYVKNIVLS